MRRRAAHGRARRRGGIALGMRFTFESLGSGRNGSHWQRSQRQRHHPPAHRLTRRGRITIGALALLCGTAAGLGVAASRDPSLQELAEVSAGAPPVRHGGEADLSDFGWLAPAPLLERLPAGREALALPVSALADATEAQLPGRLYEFAPVPTDAPPQMQGPLRVDYSLDAELTRAVFAALADGRVKLGHVILLDVKTGRVLAYASTDPERFGPTRLYPAASLVKVITASAALDADPDVAKVPCRFTGSPYRLTPARIDPPRRGREVTLARALATSNNQCFAQLAVHNVGADALRNALGRFGWLSAPAPAHAAGTAAPAADRYDVGKLGCGLAGCRITPLHAAQLATVLAHGELLAPHWIDRIADANGRELVLPAIAAPRRVISPERAEELREMLVETTTRGTARRAFRLRNGRPLLGDIRVAGKTGSLSGKDPDGRYEWFAGVAPADEPRIAVAVLVVQGKVWWRNASQVASEVLKRVFCVRGRCDVAHASRYVPPARQGEAAPPVPLVGAAVLGVTER
jgi:peptidoglycan glycosyltransferase